MVWQSLGCECLVHKRRAFMGEGEGGVPREEAVEARSESKMKCYSL